MSAFARWATLLLLFAAAPQPTPATAQTKATPETVSLIDLLVEAQTLYTLAVEKQQENLTAALDLARQAQRAVADDTVKKRTSNGARPETQDLTVLGALRARISVLVSDIPRRREYFRRQYEDVQNLVRQKRLKDARLTLDRLPADTPTADPDCPFADLRAELDRTIALAEGYRTQADGWKAVGLASDAIATYRRAQSIDPAGADYEALFEEARERSEFLTAKRREIRSLLTSRRVTTAAHELFAIEASLPAGARLYQFEVMKEELLQRQAEITTAIQAAETAMREKKYAAAERLWRDAAAIDRDQNFDERIRRARELAGGRSWVAKVFRPDVWLKQPVNQIRALIRAGRR